MRVEFVIQGEKQVTLDLVGMARRAEEPTVVLHELDADFKRLAEQQFESQGGFRSGGWAPLAPSTVEQKARLGLDPRILHATLRLRRSVTGEDEHIARTEGQEMLFGSTVPYARYHQEGTRLMPQRRVMQLSPEDVRRWVKILQSWLIQGRVRSW